MINKLFRQMLATQILSAMTVVLCMLIDSIMIGRFLGVPSMSAYCLATPILLVFAALGAMISAGVQVMCGRTMGSGNQKGTNACFTISVVLAVVISVVGVAAVLLFTDPICTLLGAGQPDPNNEVFVLTRDYLRGFIIGAPAFIMAQIMVPYMQLSGQRTRLVAAVLAMTIGDVAMDILNVFVFKMGTLGMGLASSLSYYIAFLIGLVYFFRKDCVFKLKLRLFTFKRCLKLLFDGIPMLINQISLVLLTFTLNKLLLDISGNTAVAAYSVISTVGNICYSFSSGIAAVALTLSSIFYSDTDSSSLKQLVKTMSFYAVTICAAVTLLMCIGASPLVSLFTEDESVHEIAVYGLRIFLLSLVPCALNTCFKNYYQGINRVRLSMMISVCQNFLLTAISAFLLSRFFRLSGLWSGFLAGETFTLIALTIFVFIKNKKAEISVDTYSLLPRSFGVKASDCFEISVSSQKEIMIASQKAGEFCAAKERSPKLGMIIGLCIEEMGNNIISHGFNDGKPHIIDIRLMLLDDTSVLRIRDNCKHFDPVKYLELHKEDGDLSTHIGIRMIMSIVKEANYVNSLGLNNLILTL